MISSEQATAALEKLDEAIREYARDALEHVAIDWVVAFEAVDPETDEISLRVIYPEHRMPIWRVPGIVGTAWSFARSFIG